MIRHLSDTFFSIKLVTLSRPGADSDFSVWIAVLSSSMVNSLRRVDSAVSSRLAVSSESMSLMYFQNSFAEFLLGFLQISLNLNLNLNPLFSW